MQQTPSSAHAKPSLAGAAREGLRPHAKGTSSGLFRLHHHSVAACEEKHTNLCAKEGFTSSTTFMLRWHQPLRILPLPALPLLLHHLLSSDAGGNDRPAGSAVASGVRERERDTENGWGCRGEDTFFRNRPSATDVFICILALASGSSALMAAICSRVMDSLHAMKHHQPLTAYARCIHPRISSSSMHEAKMVVSGIAMPRNVRTSPARHYQAHPSWHSPGHLVLLQSLLNQKCMPLESAVCGHMCMRVHVCAI